MSGKHEQLARDCWNMIKALGPVEIVFENIRRTEDDFDETALILIEMACDSAAESERIALGHKPRGAA